MWNTIYYIPELLLKKGGKVENGITATPLTSRCQGDLSSHPPESRENISFVDLITQAEQKGVKIFSQDDQIKVDMPWSFKSTPETARNILSELKAREKELRAYFLLDIVQAHGKFAKMARQECYERGHCRRFEFDCMLYPVAFKGTWLCRERVKSQN